MAMAVAMAMAMAILSGAQTGHSLLVEEVGWAHGAIVAPCQGLGH